MTEPADAGEILMLDPGSPHAEHVVVHRVMRDLTLCHVVTVKPYRRRHRWAWARRWL